MATIEERLAHLEDEHIMLNNDNAKLKKAFELHNITVGAMVNKADMERLNERHDKLFDALISHDQLTNIRLGDMQGQVIELDGKIVGLQTEMRQRFGDMQRQVTELDSKVVGVQTEMRQRFEAIDARFEAIDARFEAIDARFDQITVLLTAVVRKLE